MKHLRAPHLWFPRLRTWLGQKPHRLYIVLGISAVGVGIGAAALVHALSASTPVSASLNITMQTTAQQVFYSPLTGVRVANEAATKQAVTGIMIENSPDARPQSGLKQAGIVYEAVAEGGITRFLALYQEAKPTLIGPVRSVRMYYVDWLTPYNASIAHVGGSAAALKLVRNGTYRDIDQFFNGAYYWRATDRYAPHNVYTSFAKLDALNKKKGYTTSSFTGFLRHNGEASDTPNATSIDLKISSPLYNPHYDYDKKTNTYKRSINGSASNDREKGRLAPSVVIAMKVDMTTVMEDGWRESITTSGSGTAYIFQNGTVTKCTWHKASRAKPLEFLDKNGDQIALNRGQTWIAAIPNSGGGVSWK